MNTPMYDARMKICNSCEFLVENACVFCGCEPKLFALDPNEQCRAAPARWPSAIPSVADTINRGVCVPCSKNR
jgi:hypothetical protein